MTTEQLMSYEFASSLIARFVPDQRTLPRMLQAQAALYGSRQLFRTFNGTLSYDDACTTASQYAAALDSAGIRAGDRVALMCTNRIEFIQAFLGCAWRGAVAVPINTASRGAQLEHILRNCGAKLIVIEKDLTHVLTPLAATGLPLEQAWVVGGQSEDDLAHLEATSFPTPQGGMDAHPSSSGDMIAILYTSGTTGLSKGVCCPHAQYFWWGLHTSLLLGIREGDVLFTSLPLFHTNALNAFFQALLTGSTVDVAKRFSVSGFYDSLLSTKATVTYLLGAMVPMLLSRTPSEDDRKHAVRIALAPGVPPQFHPVFEERFGIKLIDGYGSTETNFVIGETLEGTEPGLMGRVRPGFQAQVVDADDNAVADGVAGELVLRSLEPFSFASGYFNMAEETIKANRNQWFHTGDRVVRQENGYFRFLDRTKDAIRRRGENISSYEVEQVIASHPEVAHAAVFPVRSELAEDEVMVSVILSEGATVTPASLLDYCQPLMPYFSVPRYVDFVTELPMTENGKVQKFKLRERGVTPTTWDRDAVGYKVQR